MGFLDDIINPAGAITGVDPVKDATGFTGTSFGPTKAQKEAAAQQGGQQTVASGSGSQGPPPSAGQYMGQFQGQQNQPLAQFGQQLAALHQQVNPQIAGIAPVGSPSATSLAANVTAQSLQNKQQQNQMFGPQTQSFWQGAFN